MFYAKMNDDDVRIATLREEDEGREQPHDGEVIEEGEETIVEKEWARKSRKNRRKTGPQASSAGRKKSEKGRAEKKEDQNQGESQSEAQKKTARAKKHRRRARDERSADAHRLSDSAILRWEPETPAPVVVF